VSAPGPAEAGRPPWGSSKVAPPHLLENAPGVAAAPTIESDADAAAQRQAQMQALFAQVELAPWDFDFYALLRRIESLHPQAPRIGQTLRPSQEPLRLGQVAELDFAPAPIVHFDRKGPGAGRLGVRFFGLLGPHGPMPLHLTEYVRERRHQHGDPDGQRGRGAHAAEGPLAHARRGQGTLDEDRLQNLPGVQHLH